MSALEQVAEKILIGLKEFITQDNPEWAADELTTVMDILTAHDAEIRAETLAQAIRALEILIHQEKVRVSGKYTEKFAAQDVSKEEVAHCHSPASIAWQNAIEVIKLDSPDPHYRERIKLKERINASENIQLNVGMLLAIYPAARQETIKEIGLYIERTKSQLAALDAPKGEMK